MKIARILVLAAAGMMLAGCGTSDGERACLELADALGTAAKRCGLDYQTNHDAFVNLATGNQGCGAIKKVRDLDAIEKECIPFINGLTCAQLNDATTAFPEGCQGQLER